MIMRASCVARHRRANGASCYGDLTGPLAIMICKPRQARKGATVAVSYVPGCGWLGCHPIPPLFSFAVISNNQFQCSPTCRVALCAWIACACPWLVSISGVGSYNRALFLARQAN